MEQSRTANRYVSYTQQKLWAYSIEKENQLRLKWLKKNEDRLEEIANQDNQRKVPEGIRAEMEEKLSKLFYKKQTAPIQKEFFLDISEDAVKNIMKPIEKNVYSLLYTSNQNTGRSQYLHKRFKKIPEEKYYFPETTNFQYGWNMSHLAKKTHGSVFARQKVIRNSFYRRRGTERDPEWYKEPAELSPQVCKCI